MSLVKTNIIVNPIFIKIIIVSKNSLILFIQIFGFLLLKMNLKIVPNNLILGVLDSILIKLISN